MMANKSANNKKKDHINRRRAGIMDGTIMNKIIRKKIKPLVTANQNHKHTIEIFIYL